MTSSKPWTHWLHGTLSRVRKARLPGDPPVRVAVMGIGQEMFGDDAAGVLVARRLKRFEDHNLLVVEACYVPENFTGAVRKFQPDLVLLVDAAQMGAAPGTIGWIDWRNTAGISVSSHTGPLSSVANFIATTMGCEVWIVGIQPADLTMDAPVSPAVHAAVDEVAEVMASVTASVDV